MTSQLLSSLSSVPLSPGPKPDKVSKTAFAKRLHPLDVVVFVPNNTSCLRPANELKMIRWGLGED
jgi:hypothetical protein